MIDKIKNKKDLNNEDDNNFSNLINDIKINFDNCRINYIYDLECIFDINKKMLKKIHQKKKNFIKKKFFFCYFYKKIIFIYSYQHSQFN